MASDAAVADAGVVDTRVVDDVRGIALDEAAPDEAAPDEEMENAAAPIVKTKTVIIGRGSLTRKEFQRVMATRISGINQCYEQYQRAGGVLEDSVLVRFFIGSEGDVEVKNVITALDFGPTMRRCIKRIIGAMQFSKPLGAGKVFVSYPFVFTADRECRKGSVSCPKTKTVTGVLLSHHRDIHSCATSDREGTVTVNFRIERSGRSSKIYTENPDGFSRRVLGCVREKVQAIRFAPPNKSVRVHYPFHFRKSRMRE